VPRASDSHVFATTSFFSFAMAAPRATSRAVLRKQNGRKFSVARCVLPQDGLVRSNDSACGRREAVRLDCAAEVGNRTGTAVCVVVVPRSACVPVRSSDLGTAWIDRPTSLPQEAPCSMGVRFGRRGTMGPPQHIMIPHSFDLGFGWHSCFRRSGRRNAMTVDGSRSIEPMMTKRDPGS
jgi:hypothetical protein